MILKKNILILTAFFTTVFYFVSPANVHAGARSEQRIAEEKRARIQVIREELQPLVAKGDLYHAEGLIQESLQLKRELYGNDSIEVADNLLSLGSLFMLMEEYEKAKACLNETLAIAVPIFGERSPKFLSVYKYLTVIYAAEGVYDKAKENAGIAAAISAETLGEDAPETLEAEEALKNIRELESQTGRNIGTRDSGVTDIFSWKIGNIKTFIATTLVLAAMLFLLGVISGAIARRKGYSFVFWWLYGTVLFPVALVHAILIINKEKTDEKAILQKVAEMSREKDVKMSDIENLVRNILREEKIIEGRRTLKEGIGCLIIMMALIAAMVLIFSFSYPYVLLVLRLLANYGGGS